MILREYQSRCIGEARRQYAEGSRAICIVAPCGAGKTVLASALASKHPGRTLMFVHRDELMTQAKAKMPPGVRVVTIQSVIASGSRPAADIVIMDECHHFIGGEVWSTVGEHYRSSGALLVGVTATPQRADGSPLGDLFTSLVVAASYSELIREGHLVECDVYAPDSRGKTLAIDPAAAVRRFESAGPAIVFCRTVGEAIDCAARIPGAVALHECTPWDERRRAVRRFRAGEIPALTSVYVLAEGFDAPNAAVCVLARGCGHASTYVQMAGRVLRPSPGKTHAVLVDLCGVTHDHGLPTEDREYSLDGDGMGHKSTAADPIWQCRACGWCTRLPPADRRCPSCGHPLPVPETLRVSERRLALQEARARHSEQQRVEAWSTLRREAAARGYKPGWAFHRFLARYGCQPPRTT
jgi:DNA repair protein RadD